MMPTAMVMPMRSHKWEMHVFAGRPGRADPQHVVLRVFSLALTARAQVVVGACEALEARPADLLLAAVADDAVVHDTAATRGLVRRFVGTDVHPEYSVIDEAQRFCQLVVRREGYQVAIGIFPKQVVGFLSKAWEDL